jgi:hypothetical protein
MVNAAPVIARQDGVVRHHGASGVPMFNDVEKMAEAAGLLARYPALRDSACSDSFSSVTIRTRHHP